MKNAATHVPIFSERIKDKVLSYVDQKGVTDLMVNLLRIPSPGEAGFIENTVDIAAWISYYMENNIPNISIDMQMGNQATELQAIGTLKGIGGGKSLMLCGHIDQAPVAPGWTRNPFGAEIEGDWIYGAGAGDMKNGVTAMISAIEAVAKAGVKLKGDVVCAPVFGERAGGLGIKTLLRKGYLTDYGIVTEPTYGTVIKPNGESIRIKGEGIRLKQPGCIDGVIHVVRARDAGVGVSAIEKAFKLLKVLGPPDTDKEYKPEWLTFDRTVDEPNLPRFRMGALDCGHSLASGEIWHAPKGNSDICYIYFDLRWASWLDMSEESILADMQMIINKLHDEDPDFNAWIECPLKGSMNAQPLNTSPDSPIVKTLSECHKYINKKEPMFPLTSPSYMDGGWMQKAGIETLVYGPVGERINQPNDRASISSIIRVTKVVALTIADMCG